MSKTSTDLAHHIRQTPLCDTHEHLKKESEWVEKGPDVLQDLFGNYVLADLKTAGASPDALKRLMDASGPDFFLYDLSWAGFCGGNIDTKSIGEDTDIEVTDLFSLRRAMERLFEKHAPCAIAVKAQHAYNRTLLWEERSDEDAARALEAEIADGDLTEPQAMQVATRLMSTNQRECFDLDGTREAIQKKVE